MKLLKVGDVSVQVRGVSYDKSVVRTQPSRGYLPLLRGGNIGDHGLIWDDLQYVPESIVSAAQVLRAGDVVLAASSGSLSAVGKAARFDKVLPATFGAFCKTLRPNKDIDASYFGHYFRTTSYRKQVSSLAAGANINNLRKEHLDDLVFPVPPLDEQRRIAAILDKADELRTKRREALAHLDALTQSIFHSMFGDVPATTTLGELCGNRFRNGVSPSTRGTIEQKVLTLSAVTGSSFDQTAVKSSTFDKPIPESNQVSNKLLLICRGNGNRALVGKGFFPRANISDVGFPDTVIAAEPNMNKVAPLFLEVAWGTPAVRAQLESAAKTTNGTFKINQTSLAAIQLPLPPLELQQTFAARVGAVERLKEMHRKHLAELDALFASLQHRAFKGEL